MRKGTHLLDPVRVDALLAATLHAAGAIDLAIGNRLAEFSRRKGFRALGYSKLGDFARQHVHVGAGVARDLRSLAVSLRATPRLRLGVEVGLVDREKAAAVLGDAIAGDEDDAIARAIALTVDDLRRVHRGEPSARARIHELALSLPAHEGAVLVAALETAGFICDRGPATPDMDRFEWIVSELIGWVAPPAGDSIEDADPSSSHAPAGAPTALVHAPALPPGELARSAAEEPEPPPPHVDLPTLDLDRSRTPAGDPHTPAGDPRTPIEVRPGDPPWFATLLREHNRQVELTRRLSTDELAERPLAVLAKELADLGRLRAARGERLGRVVALAGELRVWKSLGHASWEDYCTRRLRASERTLRNRSWLEWRLDDFPEVRRAWRAGSIGLEHARILVRLPDRAAATALLGRAKNLTVKQLDLLVRARERRQMSRTGEGTVRLPDRVVGLLGELRQALGAAFGRVVSEAKALVCAAIHFLITWLEPAERIAAAMGAVWRRDGGLCQNPTCTRAGQHRHHIWQRAFGGGRGVKNDNLVLLCSVCHLRLVHDGHLIVSGRAPDRLEWVRADGAALPSASSSALELEGAATAPA